MSELDADFATYAATDYNGKKHTAHGQTPAEYWENNIITLSADPDELDILMMESFTRVLKKSGIRFKDRIYWHSNLDTHIGETALIRSPERYFAPEEIFVFQNRRLLCKAFATDSPAGLAVSREEIAQTQAHQYRSLRNELNELEAFGSTIAADLREAAKSDDTAKPKEEQKKSGSNKAKREKNQSRADRQTSILTNLRQSTENGKEQKDDN